MILIGIGIAIGMLIMILGFGAFDHFQHRKDNTLIDEITSILCAHDMSKGIEEAKTICRNTKGLVSTGIYMALDTIQKKL